MGERVRRARWARELSLREVAAALDVSTNAVVRWEEGALPRTPALRKRIADLYAVDEGRLFEEYVAAMADLADSVNGSA